VHMAMNNSYIGHTIKKWISLAGLLCLAFSAGSLYAAKEGNDPGKGLDKKPPKDGKSAYSVRRIVIDPGHGGHDPGCVGLISKEKDVVLAISLKLGKLLESEMEDVEVSYTRKKDVFLELHQRAAIANKNNADLFISLHCNAAENKSSFGTETFVLGLHRAKDNLDVAKRENASIYFESDYEKNYEGYDPNSPQGHILLSLFQNAYLDQSIHLAEKIEKQFVSHKRSSRGVKQGGFLVLRHATMPAVLVEAGFLSHPEEEKWLNSEEGQMAIARSIFNSIKHYRENYEHKPKLAQKSDKNENTSADIKKMPADKSGEVAFYIQYATSPKKLGEVSSSLDKIGKVVCREENKTYKYQVYAQGTYEEAQLARDEVKKLGYKDAFIVAYKDGDKISLQQAMLESERVVQK
jgi:N-acetylmuramoyl-L-alanine amidase